MSLKLSPTYFQPGEPFFEVLQWQKTFLLMSLLGSGGLVLISKIPLPLTVFLVSSPTIKLGWWASSSCYCQLLGSFSACFLLQWNRIMPHYWRVWHHHRWTGDWWSHLPYHRWGSSFLLRVMLGVPTTTANKWRVFGKLNLMLVFEYFSGSALLEGERPRSYFFRAFCLYALARYFLVQNSYCVDLRICMVAYELKKGNLVGLDLGRDPQWFGCLS